jgi:TPR repeat protein
LPTPPQHAPPEQVAAPAVGAAVPQPLAPGVVATLVARGNALLATGDIAAARLMYARAAGSDSGEAAAAMGMTYDPRFLAQIGAKGIAPDPRQALVWYRRASDLGSADGARLLTQLQTASGN